MANRLTPKQHDALMRQQRAERLARYRADPLVADVRWICICDGRSCEECNSMHGQVIALNDPRWPRLLRLHAGCRCRFTWALHPPTSGSEQP